MRLKIFDEMISDIEKLISRFEDASIPRDEWRHADHLIVGLYYAANNDLEAATNKMRTGIRKLLDSFGLDPDEDSPYHETLTVFWMKTVFDFNALLGGADFGEKADSLVAKFDKDHPLKFYSREKLFSAEARRSFVEPDLDQ